MSTPTQAPVVERAVPCVARQAILAADEKVIGYELFFREGPGENRFTSDSERATSATIDALNMVGLDVLCDGYPAFVNSTREMLLTDYFALLPPRDVVVEIQEKVLVDDDVKQACERLKKDGYSVALDNFVPDDEREALVQFADFIKVDTRAIPAAQNGSLATRYASEHCRMVAQKVESREAFVEAKKNGFTCFQGYFFQHPENIRVRQIPAQQISYVRLLGAVSKPEVDFAEVEDLIKHEPSLCYRLLRYFNSPLLGLSSSPINSIRHGLNLLGEREAVRWIRMTTTIVMGETKSSDLVLSALVRARFCELIAPKVEHGKSDLFLLGMLSLMDAVLSVPIGMLIDELPLEPAIKEQLLGGKAGVKTPLTPIYELMLAREVGDWGQVTRLGKHLNLSLSFVAETSNEAMRWAHQITHTAGRTARN
ncbi:MAG TPA: HDOD domain-containing protein [Terriglobales bacterium]|jgi:c-di-GMP-related signal transduction protein|nr:HDOD domain-containing protein [Terriglobales bacterium]